MSRDRGECQLQLEGCTLIAEEIDHIAGVAELGYDNDDDENLRAACAHCHRIASWQLAENTLPIPFEVM
jgi:5-methylcytosine-specific restriction endonuclease McrA